MAKEGAFNGFIEVNGSDLSDHCREFDGPMGHGNIPTNAMGNTTEHGLPGLRTVEVTATYIQDFAAGSVHEVHSPLYNNATTFPVRWRAKLSDVSSPMYSADFYVSAFRPIGGAHGAESLLTVTYSPASDFVGGG